MSTLNTTTISAAFLRHAKNKLKTSPTVQPQDDHTQKSQPKRVRTTKTTKTEVDNNNVVD